MKNLLQTMGGWLTHGSKSEDKTDEARPQPATGTVLVIDDDPDLLGAIRSLLDDAGYTVLTSSTSVKGLLMAQYNAAVQVVVLDYRMPDLDGAETLQYLRRLRPQMKVLALSGVESTALPENYRQEANAYLSKPYNSGQLLSVIRNLLTVDSPVPANATV